MCSRRRWNWPLSERSAFLDGACSSDPSLRKEVESLLADSANVPSGFLAILRDGRNDQRGDWRASVLSLPWKLDKSLRSAFN